MISCTLMSLFGPNEKAKPDRLSILGVASHIDKFTYKDFGGWSGGEGRERESYLRFPYRRVQIRMKKGRRGA